MRLFFDTNVLVSAFLNSEGPPGRLWARIVAPGSDVLLLWDERILAEYEAVLARPKFRFGPALIEAVVRFVRSEATVLVSAPPLDRALPDEKDRPFVEVALAGNALIATGDRKGFPSELGVQALTCRELLGRLDHG